MLRRTSSTSHIPLPKTDFRPRSKSIARNSNNKDSNINPKKSLRSGSFEKLPLPGLQRQLSSTNIRKTTVTTPTLQNFAGSSGIRSSRSTSIKKGSTTPTLQNLGPSSGRPRSNVVTPASSSRTKSKSPGRADRTVNDKKWVSEQYVKVRNYLQQHHSCQYNVPDIKPPTINTFVFVINLLFKDIDSRIEINMANYKDEVLRRLKGMHYPANISSSLLKTVNTMHAWPHIISIFAWLVDISNLINSEEPEPITLKQKKMECAENYITKRYITYNEGGDEKLVDLRCKAEMEKLLNITEAEIDQNIISLQEEIKKLTTNKEKQLEQIREKENKNCAMKKKIDELEFEIETFYVESEQKERELDHVIDHLKQRKHRIAEAVKIKKENIAKLQKQLKNQPCTHEEKTKLLTHIEEMKHTLDLKKENLVAKKEYKRQREVKLAELKKNLETKIYHINKELMKLSTIKPELKELNLPETGFTSKNFANKIKIINEKKKQFENQINTEIGATTEFINKIKNENEKLSNQIEKVKNEIKTIEEKTKISEENINKYNNQINSMLKEHEREKALILEKIQKLKDNEPDIKSLTEKLNYFFQLKNKKKENLENMMKQSVLFFDKLNDLFMSHLEKKNEIRTDIFNFLEGCLRDVANVQGEIVEDLKTLDNLKK